MSPPQNTLKSPLGLPKPTESCISPPRRPELPFPESALSHFSPQNVSLFEKPGAVSFSTFSYLAKARFKQKFQRLGSRLPPLPGQIPIFGNQNPLLQNHALLSQMMAQKIELAQKAALATNAQTTPPHQNRGGFARQSQTPPSVETPKKMANSMTSSTSIKTTPKSDSLVSPLDLTTVTMRSPEVSSQKEDCQNDSAFNGKGSRKKTALEGYHGARQVKILTCQSAKGLCLSLILILNQN